jgi:hypothetical protein
MANMGFVATGDIMHIPELINERWFDRYQMGVTLRRQIFRTYPVLSFVSVSGIIVTDNPNLKPVAFSTGS